MVPCVVLAAGASTRMGTPKALLRQGGETALARIMRVAKLAGCAPVIVVVGGDAHVAEEAERTGAQVLNNPHPEQGRTGTFQLGARAAGGERVLVWPVDRPSAAEATVRALLATPADVVLPLSGTQHGHPIVLGGEALREALALAADTPLHEVVHRDPKRVREVPVPDAGVLVNLDTPGAAVRHGWG
ncbi:MAG: NTP transferase domain-containing protein [Halobacteriales archaeon]|nr:NTP transferase domain-containing protein [Halobacteriales archaeon]